LSSAQTGSGQLRDFSVRNNFSAQLFHKLSTCTVLIHSKSQLRSQRCAQGQSIEITQNEKETGLKTFGTDAAN
jgi:hypothetical protein